MDYSWSSGVRRRVDNFVVPVPVVAGLALFCLVGLGYILLVCQCEQLGRQIKAIESRRTSLLAEYGHEEYRWALMRSPANLEKALAFHRLAMTWPTGGQLSYLGAGLPEVVFTRAGSADYSVHFASGSRRDAKQLSKKGGWNDSD